MGDTQIAAKLAEPFGSYSQIIADNAAELGEKIAIRDDDAEITWAQLGEKVERIAARLLEEGLERGQSVAILGYSSIPYALVFLAAVRAGRDVALANKEVMVMAGALMLREVKAHGVTLLPVDSEHNAIFQCLQGGKIADVRSITLTASGGPLRMVEDLSAVTPEQAIAHPNWDMGAKITIDSATLANKALEVIEAHYLYGLAYDRIDAVVPAKGKLARFNLWNRAA